MSKTYFMETKTTNKSRTEKEEFINYYKRLFYARCSDIATRQQLINAEKLCKDMGRSAEQMQADFRRIDNVLSAVDLFIKKAVYDNFEELSK